MSMRETTSSFFRAVESGDIDQVDGGASCITEPEAKEFADSLFVAQTQ
jgi:hypothetical protein